MSTLQKWILVISAFILLFNGCTTMKQFNQDCQKDINNTGYIYERTFEYPYKEVFLATLNVVRDWGGSIFLKDYDRGLISARDISGNNMSMPGRICGLSFQSITQSQTKVTLRVTRRTYGLESAKPEDVFNTIDSEIEFMHRMKE